MKARELTEAEKRSRKIPLTLEECQEAIDAVGEILAVIAGMGSPTVARCKPGMMWPWMYEAYQALTILGKSSVDYEVPDDAFHGEYWDSDRPLAVTARDYVCSLGSTSDRSAE